MFHPSVYQARRDALRAALPGSLIRVLEPNRIPLGWSEQRAMFGLD